MSETVTISVKVPKEMYAELSIRVPEGERSTFVRDAIIEKFQKTPSSSRILELEQRIQRIEADVSFIKGCLAELEFLTFERGKVNPHTFCVDKTDNDIMDYLVHYKGATTAEIAQALNVNRWLVLNRLKKIMRRSKKQLGKPVVRYLAAEKTGKKKAWWLDEELTEEIPTSQGSGTADKVGPWPRQDKGVEP